MALTPEMKAKLDAAIAAQNKRVDEIRKESLSSVKARKLDWENEADVNLFLEFQAGNTKIVNRDELAKRPELHKTIYCTVTGYHANDDATTIEKDKNGKEYRTRVLYVDIQGGGATILFFNEYVEDFVGGITKGTVISTKGVPVAKGTQMMSKGRETNGVTEYNYVEYLRDAWYAFSSFGHKTSAQEMIGAMATPKLNQVVAELEA